METRLEGMEIVMIQLRDLVVGLQSQISTMESKLEIEDAILAANGLSIVPPTKPYSSPARPHTAKSSPTSVSPFSSSSPSSSSSSSSSSTDSSQSLSHDHSPPLLSPSRKI